MSMHPRAVGSIPEETVRVACAAFPHGNIHLTMRDQLGTLYEDENFAALFPKRGRPAEAVRSRIDWKYILSLELSDPGFDFSVLSRISDPSPCRISRAAAARDHAGAV
jgi:transposase